MDTPGLLRLASAEVCAEVVNLLTGMSTEDWYRPTPCVGWTVRDIAAHIGHVEGMLVHAFPQPDPPPDWDPTGYSPLDQATNAGVTSRREWSTEQVLDEVTRACRATFDLLAAPDLDWDGPAPTPIGPAPRWTAVEMRVTDLVVHLADLRMALDLPLTENAPLGLEAAVGRARRLTPWAWVKRAGAREGETIHLRLTGTGGGDTWITVRQGRAEETSPEEGAVAEIEGAAFAYLLAVTGRHALVGRAGGLVVHGERARRLLADYRLVG